MVLRVEAMCVKVTQQGVRVAKKSVMVYQIKEYVARALNLGREGRCLKVYQEKAMVAKWCLRKFKEKEQVT